MMDFKLHVFSALPQDRFEPPLSPNDFPQGVLGTLEVYPGGELPLPADAATLLLTDDSKLVRELSDGKPDRLHIVYIGPDAEVAGLEGSLDDIWAPDQSPVALKRRYMKVLNALKREFDLWFYQNALLSTINTVPDMLWYKRLDGIHMLVNDAFTEIVHKPKDDIHGKDHFYIWDAPRPAEGSGDFACAESEEIAISSGKTYICDEPVKTREGLKQFTTYKSPVYDMFGNVFGTVGVGHDVTNFSNLGIELSILVENIPFPMTIFTPDWKVVRMNSAFSALTGTQTKEDIARFDYRAWKAEHLVQVGEAQEDTVKHSVSREYQLTVDGKTRYFFVIEMEIRDYFDNVSGYFSTMRDLTYQRAYEQSILEAANTDILTGMHNRRYFYHFLSESIGKPFHLLYMDLDGFKSINDSYGHNIGDNVLTKTADLIREHFPDLTVARLGGDEFVVIDGEHDRAYIEAQCEKLEAAILNAFQEYGKGTTISIGIAHTDGTSSDMDRLIQESDTRMYESKKRHHEAR